METNCMFMYVHCATINNVILILDYQCTIILPISNIALTSLIA